jgi:hypothetical protein
MSTRLAVVISSNYSENNVLFPREAFDDTASLVASKLSELGTGYEVVELKATRDLPEQLDELLSNRRVGLEQLLLHFCGYLAVKPDRGLALLLDGPRLRAYPLSRLRSSLVPASNQTMVIMDVLAVAEGPRNLDEIAAGLGVALNAASPHVGVVTSVAFQEDVDAQRRGCQRLSDLWLLSLEYRARHSNGNAVGASSLVHDLQREPLSFASLASFDYQPSAPEFAMLLGSDAPWADDKELPTERQSSIPAPLDLPLPLPKVAPSPLPPLRGIPASALDMPPPPPPMSPPPPPEPAGAWSGQAEYFPSAPPPVARTIADVDLIASLQETLASNPRDARSLRALSDAAQRERDVVTAALASAILVALGEARPEDEVRHAKLVSDTLPLAQRTFNDDDFEELAVSNQLDVDLLKTLGCLAEPALASGLGYNADADYTDLPKDATIIDPESSTITLGRSLIWVCKYLSINTPQLVIVPDLSTFMTLAPANGGRLLISRQLGSGLSLAQLAFLGARHLAMLRPEFKWRATLDTVSRLAKVIECCIGYSRDGRDFVKSVEDGERKAVKRFLSQIEGDATLSALVTQQFSRLELDYMERASLAEQIIVGSDRALIHSGLLGCANPTAAWELTQRYTFQSPLSVAEQLDEIARYTTSQEHLALRESLGLSVNRL